MSLFNNNTIQEMSDEMIEHLYNLEWEYDRGKRIKKGLFPKKNINDLYSNESLNIYYNPGYIFYRCLSAVEDTIRINTYIRGRLILSSLDESNLRVRFKKMIKECEMLRYKSTEYIRFNLYDRTDEGLRHKIVEMMYNYIATETVNSKYFKK